MEGNIHVKYCYIDIMKRVSSTNSFVAGEP